MTPPPISDSTSQERRDWIRKCAAGKGYGTCADCSDKATCDKLAPFMNHEEARKNLGI